MIKDLSPTTSPYYASEMNARYKNKEGETNSGKPIEGRTVYWNPNEGAILDEVRRKFKASPQRLLYYETVHAHNDFNQKLRFIYRLVYTKDKYFKNKE